MPTSETDLQLLTLPALVAKYDRFTQHETGARAVAIRLELSAAPELDSAEFRLFDRWANEYAARAWTRLNDHGPAHNSSDGNPMVMITTVQDVSERVRALGVPHGHIADHSIWAVTRAFDAAMTWVYLECGFQEVIRRYEPLAPKR